MFSGTFHVSRRARPRRGAEKPLPQLLSSSGELELCNFYPKFGQREKYVLLLSSSGELELCNLFA